MNQKRLVLFSIVLLVGLGATAALLVYGSSSSQRAATSRSEAADGTERGAEIAPEVEAKSGSDLVGVSAREQGRASVDFETASAERSAEDLFEVRVSVTDPDGAAVGGVPLTLSFNRHDGEQWIRGEKSATSDERGLARVELESSSNPLHVEAARSEHFAMRRVRVPAADRRGVSGRVVDMEIKLTPGGSLAGQVLTSSGAPVPNATVDFWNAAGWLGPRSDSPPEGSVQATSNGEFELEHMGPQLLLLPRAPGYAALHGLHGSIAEGLQQDDVILRMQPALETRGSVTMDGVPLAAAQVRLERGSRDPEQYTANLATSANVTSVVTADSDGNFTTSAVPEWPIRLTVSSEGARLHSERVVFDGAPLRIDCPGWRPLDVRVEDASGVPIEDASVTLSEESAPLSEGERPKRQTDATGACRFDRVVSRPGVYVDATHADHARPERWQGDIRNLAGELVLRLESGCRIFGLVVDTEGAPVANASVLAEFEHEGRVRAGLDQFPRTRSSASGEFELIVPSAPVYTLRVQTEGEPRMGASMEVSCSADVLKLVVRPNDEQRVRFEGRVRDAISGEPIRTFSLMATRLESGGSSTTIQEISDDEGRFEYGGLETGRYALGASAVGYAVGSTGVISYEPGLHEIDFELYPSRNLELFVVDAQGEPVDGVEVLVLDMNGNRLERGANPLDAMMGRGESDFTRAGEVTLTALPAAPVQIEFRDLMFILSESIDVDLTNPIDGVLDVKLDWSMVHNVRWIGFHLVDQEFDMSMDGFDRFEALFEHTIELPLDLVALDSDGQAIGQGTLALSPERVPMPVTLVPGRCIASAAAFGVRGPEVVFNFTSDVDSVRVTASGHASVTLDLQPKVKVEGGEVVKLVRL